jgi:uncharacterized membrane protein
MKKLFIIVCLLIATAMAFVNTGKCNSKPINVSQNAEMFQTQGFDLCDTIWKVTKLGSTGLYECHPTGNSICPSGSIVYYE